MLASRDRRSVYITQNALSLGSARAGDLRCRSFGGPDAGRANALANPAMSRPAYRGHSP
jgi:hypothetical protein